MRTWISASTAGLALVLGLAAAQPAHALIGGACILTGIPQPCVITDAKGTAQSILKVAQDAQKSLQTIEQIKSIKQQAATIGSSIDDLVKIDINLPKLDDVKMPAIDGMLAPITGAVNSVSIQSVGEKFSTQLFAPTEATEGAISGVVHKRQVLTKEANADSFAHVMKIQSSLAANEDQLKALVDSTAATTTLREDWAANSQIKQAIVGALHTRSLLLSQFLKAKSAQGSNNLPARSYCRVASSSISYTGTPQVLDDTREQLNALTALLINARRISASNQIVLTSNAAIETLNGIIADAERTTALKNAQMANFQNFLTRVVGGVAAKALLDRTYSALASTDQNYAAIRNTDVGEINAQEFANRGVTQADLNAMVEAGVDPRQFLGTWADPYKDTLAKNISASMKNMLPDEVDGGDAYKEFQANVTILNELRLQEAWKKVLAQDAKVMIEQSNSDIAQQNAEVGFGLSTQSTTDALNQLATKANELAQTIAGRTDEGAKEAAADTMKQLQEVLGVGVNLPYVDPTTVGEGNSAPQ